MPNANRVPDFRMVPNYSFGEAAHYLRVPVSTLRAWSQGQRGARVSVRPRFRPVISLPESGLARLSFTNLVEAHALSALRSKLSLQRIRRALDFVKRELGSEHPLAEYRFETDGVDLFLKNLWGLSPNELISASQAGQLSSRELLKAYLRRIEHDANGHAIRFYPFTHSLGADQPKRVVIDPRVSFGRPTLTGTGIPTAVIADRYKAGESVADLASDYSRTPDEIEEAIRTELSLDAA